MSWLSLMSSALFILIASLPNLVSAGDPFPPNCSVTAAFARTHPLDSCWQPGAPYRYVTVVPGGNGETFAAMGISITVTLRDILNNPCVGFPASDVVLYKSSLAICAALTADTDTDTAGVTTFSGTLNAGGCTPTLDVYANGQYIDTIPVGVNSPDLVPASPFYVDASDVAALAAILGTCNLTCPQCTGSRSGYTICSDWNEDGFIDAGDVAFLASHLARHC